MIAIDTNIIIYAHRYDNPFQKRAQEWLEHVFQKEDICAIPYHCIIEFLAISTNPRIYKDPTPPETAFEQIENLLECDNVKILSEIENQLSLVKELSLNTAIKGSEFHDVRIAAVCLENGVSVLYSADRNFSRFSKLKVVNPLV